MPTLAQQPRAWSSTPNKLINSQATVCVSTGSCFYSRLTVMIALKSLWPGFHLCFVLLVLCSFIKTTSKIICVSSFGQAFFIVFGALCFRSFQGVQRKQCKEQPSVKAISDRMRQMLRCTINPFFSIACSRKECFSLYCQKRSASALAYCPRAYCRWNFDCGVL